MLASIYAELLKENDVDLSQGITEQDSYFFDDAINAIGAICNYGAPVYIQLKTFEHIQSTGLQITGAPGKMLVYFGFALLVAGVFFMFYVVARRVWSASPAGFRNGIYTPASDYRRSVPEFVSDYCKITGLRYLL